MHRIRKRRNGICQKEIEPAHRAKALEPAEAGEDARQEKVAGVQTKAKGAVEAKEKIRLGAGGSILGSITLQHFLGLYPKMCGMTATAQPAADEFLRFYGLKVVVIPPHRKCVRIDHPDRIFTQKASKLRALIAEIEESHARQRPVLVGTASVEESEELASELKKAGVSCQVLNAKNDELEAEIIAQAGQPGAITISTNMAGRGTDIKLGGDKEQERDKVIALGGLYVIGTNRYESLRIDTQLRGRAGRQGDPGSSRFFIGLDDNLIERYGIKNLFPKKYRTLEQEAPPGESFGQPRDRSRTTYHRRAEF